MPTFGRGLPRRPMKEEKIMWNLPRTVWLCRMQLHKWPCYNSCRRAAKQLPYPQPFIAITARTGDGIHTLLGAVADVIEGNIVTKPLRVHGTPEFQKAVNELVPMIEQMAPGIPNARWLAIRLLDGDARVQKALSTGELADIVSRQQRADVQFSGKMSVEGRQ